MSLMSKLFPGVDFWANFINKFFSFFVSFKAYLIALASIFLVLGNISGGEWVTVIVSIGLGRVIIQGIAERAKPDQTITIIPRGE